jgi:hypothetical protein
MAELEQQTEPVTKKRTVADLGRAMKKKFPKVYDDVDDEDLGRAAKKKYPGAYDDFEDPSFQTAPPASQATGQLPPADAGGTLALPSSGGGSASMLTTTDAFGDRIAAGSVTPLPEVAQSDATGAAVPDATPEQMQEVAQFMDKTRKPVFTQPDNAAYGLRDRKIRREFEEAGRPGSQYTRAREAAKRKADTWTEQDEVHKRVDALLFQRDLLRARANEVDRLRMEAVDELGDPLYVSEIEDEAMEVQAGFDYLKESYEKLPTSDKELAVRQRIANKDFEEGNALNQGVMNPLSQTATAMLLNTAGSAARMVDAFINIPQTITDQEPYYSPFAQVADEITGVVEKVEAMSPTVVKSPLFGTPGLDGKIHGWRFNKEGALPKAVAGLTYMVGLGTAGAAGGIKGMTAASFLTTEEDYYREAITAGLKPEQAQGFSIRAAITTSLLESVNPGPLLRRSSKQMLKKALKDVAGGKLTTKEALKEWTTYTTKEALGEGGQELTQGWGDLANKAATNIVIGEPDGKGGIEKKLSVETSMQEMAEQFALGAALGGLVGGASALRRKPLTREAIEWAVQHPDQMTEAISALPPEQQAAASERFKAYQKAYDGMPKAMDGEDKAEARQEMADALVEKQVIAQERKEETPADDQLKALVEEQTKMKYEAREEEANERIRKAAVAAGLVTKEQADATVEEEEPASTLTSDDAIRTMSSALSDKNAGLRVEEGEATGVTYAEVKSGPAAGLRQPVLVTNKAQVEERLKEVAGRMKGRPAKEVRTAQGEWVTAATEEEQHHIDQQSDGTMDNAEEKWSALPKKVRQAVELLYDRNAFDENGPKKSPTELWAEYDRMRRQVEAGGAMTEEALYGKADSIAARVRQHFEESANPKKDAEPSMDVEAQQKEGAGAVPDDRTDVIIPPTYKVAMDEYKRTDLGSGERGRAAKQKLADEAATDEGKAFVAQQVDGIKKNEDGTITVYRSGTLQDGHNPATTDKKTAELIAKERAEQGLSSDITTINVLPGDISVVVPGVENEVFVNVTGENKARLGNAASAPQYTAEEIQEKKAALGRELVVAEKNLNKFLKDRESGALPQHLNTKNNEEALAARVENLKWQISKLSPVSTTVNTPEAKSAVAKDGAVPDDRAVNEQSRTVNKDGSSSLVYGFAGGEGHANVRIHADGGTAHITDIQLGEQDSAIRGRGVGLEAYQAIAEQLLDQGVTLRSTRWTEDGSAISPAALRVWEKLSERGLARQTGTEPGKVVDRFTGLDEAREIPLYEFTGPTAPRSEKPPVSTTVNTPEAKPAEQDEVMKVRAGDRVTFLKNNKELSGTVRDVDTDRVSIDTDQITTAGGVPIGRIELVPHNQILHVEPREEEGEPAAVSSEREQVIKNLDAAIEKARARVSGQGNHPPEAYSAIADMVEQRDAIASGAPFTATDVTKNLIGSRALAGMVTATNKNGDGERIEKKRAEEKAAKEAAKKDLQRTYKYAETPRGEELVVWNPDKETGMGVQLTEAKADWVVRLWDIDADKMATMKRLPKDKFTRAQAREEADRLLNKKPAGDVLVVKPGATPEGGFKKEPEPKPAFKEKDQVKFTKGGKELTGHIRRIDVEEGTALVDVDQVALIGGRIPIGRLETVKLANLQLEGKAPIPNKVSTGVLPNGKEYVYGNLSTADGSTSNNIMVVDGAAEELVDGAEIINEMGRWIVRAKLPNGKTFPFYVSNSGTSGKEAGKWYPFFGIAKNGWLIKGSMEQLESEYGIEELSQVSKNLNERLRIPGSFMNPVTGEISDNGKVLMTIGDLASSTSKGPTRTITQRSIHSLGFQRPRM